MGSIVPNSLNSYSFCTLLPLSCALIDFCDTSLVKGGSVHVGFPGEDRSLFHFSFSFQFLFYYPSPRLLGGCVLKTCSMLSMKVCGILLFMDHVYLAVDHLSAAG